jgi:hypothetical protein
MAFSQAGAGRVRGSNAYVYAPGTYMPTRSVGTYAPPAEGPPLIATSLFPLGERGDRDRRFHQPARAG